MFVCLCISLSALPSGNMVSGQAIIKKPFLPLPISFTFFAFLAFRDVSCYSEFFWDKQGVTLWFPLFSHFCWKFVFKIKLGEARPPHPQSHLHVLAHKTHSRPKLLPECRLNSAAYGHLLQETEMMASSLGTLRIQFLINLPHTRGLGDRFLVHIVNFQVFLWFFFHQHCPHT